VCTVTRTQLQQQQQLRLLLSELPAQLQLMRGPPAMLAAACLAIAVPRYQQLFLLL
jgi:hypothetical protein